MEDVQAALLRFLRAFSRLQLDEMMGFFADDASEFFPIEHQPLLLVGKDVIGDAFARVLAREE